jgi:hypothetical protein
MILTIYAWIAQGFRLIQVMNGSRTNMVSSIYEELGKNSIYGPCGRRPKNVDLGFLYLNILKFCFSIDYRCV